MQLSELEIGDTTTICSMDKIETKFRNRLMDIGVYEGADVTVVNKMAFGKMIVIEVDDVEVCIRKSDAKRIDCK